MRKLASGCSWKSAVLFLVVSVFSWMSDNVSAHPPKKGGVAPAHVPTAREIQNAPTPVQLARLAGFFREGGHFHDEHGHHHDHHHVKIDTRLALAPDTTEKTAAATSGKGAWTFKFLDVALPAEAKPHEVHLHGGFDQDKEGNIYFGLLNVGVLKLSPDFKTWTVLPVHEDVQKKAHVHNMCVFYGDDGTGYLAIPVTGAQKVFIATLDGKLVRVLEKPQHNEYYTKGGAFVPCDVEFVPGADGKSGVLWTVTGYSAGDYAVAADPFTGEWLNKQWFGGKGNAPGQLQTGHGITLNRGSNALVIANRSPSKRETFSRDGTNHMGTLQLPAGSNPCDFSFLGSDQTVTAVASLNSPEKGKGAPVYVLKGDEIVSTIIPREDLGLPKVDHIHNVMWFERGGKTYIIGQAWNPGFFFILERVEAGAGKPATALIDRRGLKVAAID